MSDATKRPYHERRLDEIRSKFSSSAANFGIEAIDVHLLLSLASLPYEDDKDALIAALRAEVAELHKVVIDAMAAASEAPGRTEAYEAVIAILDTAPEPSDDTLAAIEAQDDAR